ncbi:hypothetical protein ACW9UR_13805 [Halovulum sp. GXIMD14794]
MKLKLDGYDWQSALVRVAKEKNDFTGIVELLRDHDETVSSEVRELVASKLDGSFKAQRGRRKILRMPRERLQAVICYDWLLIVENWPSDAAKMEVARIFLSSSAKDPMREISRWLKQHAESLQGLHGGSAATCMALGIHQIRFRFLAEQYALGEVTLEDLKESRPAQLK